MVKAARLRFRRLLILIGTATFLVATLVVFREVLVPFIVAVILAYVLHPAVKWLHERRIGEWQLPSWLAVILLYVVLIGAMALFATTLLPRIGEETANLVRAAPGFFARVRNEWIPEADRALAQNVFPFLRGEEEGAPAQDETEPSRPAVQVRPLDGGGYEIALTGGDLVVEQVDEGRFRIGPAEGDARQTFDLQRQFDDVLARVAGRSEVHALTALRYTQWAVELTIEVVIDFVLTLMIAAFILATLPQIWAFFRSLFPPRMRPDFDQLLKRVDGGLHGVIRGQILVCLINGALSGVGFAIVGLKYWPLLTVLATVLSLIPFFGTVVSAIPAVVIGLSQGWTVGIFVLIWVIAVHIAANVFTPKIMGDAAKMHPVVVVFALVAGANAGGALGMLLGVPVASILQSAFRFLRARAYEEEDESEQSPPPDETPGEGDEAEPGPAG